MSALDAALDRLDLAFADLPPSFLDELCDRCFTAEERATLAGPVGQVPDELVASVMAGWWEHYGEGMPALVHRLAARFLRVLVNGRFDGPVERTGQLFWEVEWRSWPQAAAVEAVFQAWLDEPPIKPALEFVVGATRGAAPWLARLSPEQLRDALETVDFHPHDEVTTAVADWLLGNGLGVLSRLSEGTDEAVTQLAYLEYWRQLTSA